jgi:hypothetical protein
MSFFDWNYYLDNNLDLKHNAINTYDEALNHWNNYGIIEGRKHKYLKTKIEFYIKNIDNLITNNYISKEDGWNLIIEIINEDDNKIYGCFDWKYYIENNKNLFKEFINVELFNEKNATDHFNTIGKYNYEVIYKDYLILENISKDNFDWIYYIKNNLDLIKNNIISYDSSWNHWYNYGKYENRLYKTKFDREIIFETFDWEYYLDNNLDIKNKFLTQEGAWQHWIYNGRNENRKIRLYNNIKTEELIYQEININNIQELTSVNKIIENYEIMIKKNIIKKNITPVIVEENIIKENISEVIVEENIIKENIVEENIVEENIVEENISKENITEVIVEENISKENITEVIIEENIIKENIVEENISKENITEVIVEENIITPFLI